MNRFQPSRIAIASVVFTFLTCGTIASTLTISDNSQHQAFRIPFREVNHRILVNVEVDGTPTTLLLDTGARVSVLLNQKGYDCELRVAHRPKGKFALACNDGAPTVCPSEKPQGSLILGRPFSVVAESRLRARPASNG